MVGTADLDLIRQHLKTLTPSDRIVEFGPWLGAVSELLARAGELHVVDSFTWTKDHAKRVPDLLEPGASFRPVFEANLAAKGLSAIIHEADFADFRWTAGSIRLAFVDGPKSTAALVPVLVSIWHALAADTVLIIKHARNPAYSDMSGFVTRLVAKGVLRTLAAAGDPSCNSAVLGIGPAFSGAEDLLALAGEVAAEASVATEAAAEAMGTIGRFLAVSLYDQAYEALDRLPPSAENLKTWDRLEEPLFRRARDPEALAQFAEIFQLHNDRGQSDSRGLQPFHRSPAQFLRAFWSNAAGKPWRGKSFHPEALKKVQDFGYAAWPQRLQTHVRDRRVLDVGCGSGLHGLAFLAAGASSYTGVDPALSMDSDRVKNLSARDRAAYGWSPRKLQQMFPAWRAVKGTVPDLPTDEIFDLAVLHDAVEHLSDPAATFAGIAARVTPGGLLIFTHHNYYSWNGHHQAPESPATINPSDAGQMALVDWGHIGFRPPADHYIARSLNRIRIADLLALVEQDFTIETLEETRTKPDQGADRLTDAIRRRHPDLTDRDFLTQNLFVIARRK